MQKKRIAMIGSGSWATALSKIIHNNIEKLNWYIREPEIIDNINMHNRNSLYLSSIKFDRSRLELFDDINKCIENSDILVFCIPSKFIKLSVNSINVSLEGKQIVSAIKGIEAQENKLMSEYFIKQFGLSDKDVAVIAGPCHAEEVAFERLSYLTIGSQNIEFADEVAKLLNSYYIKTCVSKDVIGLEYSAVLKNVMALAAGICHGLGYGDNFTSVLISNSIQEIKRFVDVVKPLERDIDASGYLGDLLVTAYSQFSRNRTFGTMIGKGYSVKSAELEMNMIAEGYYGVNCIKKINENYGVDMPITDAVYNILYERISPAMEFGILSERMR
jgi:glycerol-3-phosphate dehydrogenase (NAD(P)+)